jgi:group I intron endonuclease
MTSVVYQIKCTNNPKSYIGVSFNFKKRKGEHLNKLTRNIHHNKPLQNAFNKYGKDTFEFVVLHECDDYDYAKELERQMLYSFYKDDLFNTTNKNGGFMPYNTFSKNRPVSEETKKKLSKARLGTKHTEEAREKISKALLGNTYTRGHKQSAESNEKRRTASKGNPTRFKPKTVYVLNGVHYYGSIEASQKTNTPRTTLMRYAELNKNGWSCFTVTGGK